MRYTEQPNPNVLTVPDNEIWIGVIPNPKPYIALASRLDGDGAPVAVCRFSSVEARAMAAELIRLAAEIEAPNN